MLMYVYKGLAESGLVLRDAGSGEDGLKTRHRGSVRGKLLSVGCF